MAKLKAELESSRVVVGKSQAAAHEAHSALSAAKRELAASRAEVLRLKKGATGGASRGDQGAGAPAESEPATGQRRPFPQLAGSRASSPGGSGGSGCSGSSGSSGSSGWPSRSPTAAVATDKTQKLFKAVIAEDLGQIERLLLQGASLEERNLAGLNAHDLAKERNKRRVLAWLRSRAPPGS